MVDLLLLLVLKPRTPTNSKLYKMTSLLLSSKKIPRLMRLESLSSLVTSRNFCNSKMKRTRKLTLVSKNIRRNWLKPSRSMKPKLLERMLLLPLLEMMTNLTKR